MSAKNYPSRPARNLGRVSSPSMDSRLILPRLPTTHSVRGRVEWCSVLYTREDAAYIFLCACKTKYAMDAGVYRYSWVYDGWRQLRARKNIDGTIAGPLMRLWMYAWSIFFACLVVCIQCIHRCMYVQWMCVWKDWCVYWLCACTQVYCHSIAMNFALSCPRPCQINAAEIMCETSTHREHWIGVRFC